MKRQSRNALIAVSEKKSHINILWLFSQSRTKANLDVYERKFTSHKLLNLLLMKQIIPLSINTRVDGEKRSVLQL